MSRAMHRYRAEMRLVVRATTAAVLSFVTAEWLGLPQSYWAVMTALIIVQLSLGGTIAAGMDRFAGTLAGGIFAGAVAFAGKLLGVHPLAVLVLTVAPLAFLAALYPSFRIAPITAAIVLLATPTSTSPIVSAVHRIEEIVLGTVIGVLVSIFLLPSRARQICFERSAAMLRLLGETVVLHLQPPDIERRRAIDRLNDRTLAELGKIRTAEQEALRERAISMSDEAVVERLTRTLRRIRSDVAFVGRAAAADIDWARLGAPLREVADAIREACEGLAAAMAEEASVPGLPKLDEAIARLRSELSEGRNQPARVGNLLFVIDAMRCDLADLVGLLTPSSLAVPPSESAA